MSAVVRILLVIFSLGWAWSMSLMSTAAYAFALLSLFCLAPSRSSEIRRAWVLGLAWIVYVALGLGVKAGWSSLHQNLGFAVMLLAPLGIVGLSSLRFDSCKERSAWLGLSGVGVLLSIGMCLYQVFVLGMGRADGFLKNSVYLAMNHLVGVAFFLAYRSTQESSAKRTRVLCLSMALALLLAIALSGSRFAFVVGLGFLLFYEARAYVGWARERPLLVGILSAVLVAVASIVVVRAQLWDRFAIFFDPSQSDKSATGRLEIWKINWQTFKDHPWLGVGFRQNAIALADYPSLKGVLPPGSRSIFAHNQLLQTLAESGVAGLALLVAYLWSLWKVLRPQANALFAVLILLSLSDAPLTVSRFVYSWIFFLILSFALKPSEAHAHV